MTQRSDLSGVGGELGPALQCLQSAAQLGLNASVPASGSLSGNVIVSNGWKSFAVGLKSTQAGQISVQRFLDLAGTVPQGAAVTAALTANTAGYATVGADGLPFASVQVTVTNSGASAATLSNVQGLFQAS
ncbi:hypothetical protein F4827_003082 [Paraburkholderia bannensis]|uniref:Uncharacterized protein n=1 Tax=Paraburkholderia bannensis TaxID=765414 RepID=A0A7W9WTD3_9BURK|nr:MULTISPECIES: hypothetical protein [Paraburkholderia]MBB3258214.1 hypothetical protein [Paraburkholderia sp. WP4_3_2]MBB6103227.1 hypothetical protein [Paraburkholderia bannensis]